MHRENGVAIDMFQKIKHTVGIMLLLPWIKGNECGIKMSALDFINLGTVHGGHVAVVVPGGPILTNAGEYVPACMDTGCEMRSKKQGLNYSFGKDKRPYVEFYYYK